MKKIIFFCLIFLSVLLNAQDFTGGVLGGFTGSQIDGDNYAGYYKMGLNAGAWVKREFSETASFQMEIKYEGKGAGAHVVFNPNVQAPPDLYRVGLHYLEVPIMYVYQFHPKFSFYIGAEFGYLFLAKYRDGYGDVNTVDVFKKFELAALTGLFYNVNDRLSACIRFSYSITPIYTTEGGVATWFSYRSSYNNGLGLCAYYRLGN